MKWSLTQKEKQRKGRERKRRKDRRRKGGRKTGKLEGGSRSIQAEWRHYKAWQTLKGPRRVQRGDLIPSTRHLSYWRNERSPPVTVTGSSGAGRGHENGSRAKSLCHRELMMFPSLGAETQKEKIDTFSLQSIPHAQHLPRSQKQKGGGLSRTPWSAF